ncbi:MAG: DUF362 domain-containing protein [Candidatus Methanomethylicaceae archaeon]|nr:DUF362 domain-containing protein [Candidatus Verstraetearchaeota archaeon]
MEYVVAIVNIKNGIMENIKKALELINWQPDGESFLIKPNMINSKKSDEGVTTDPRIVYSIIEFLKKFRCRIFVGDSPGNAYPGRAKEVFEATGMLEIIKNSGAKFIEFESLPPIRVNLNGKILDSITIASPIFENRIINIPKLKTHIQTLMTGAIKNISMGCIPGSGKTLIHKIGTTPEKMAMAIIDIYSIIRPMISLNIMDAIVCMEGNGPTNGTPIRLNKILVSTDALALDMISFKMAGLNPLKVPYINEAVKRNIGPKSLDDISIVGDNFEIFKFKIPSTFIINMYSLLSYFAPIIAYSVHVNYEKCIGCGICVNACPTKAISIKKKALIDKSKCMKCYICHELCEYGAIVLKRTLI